MTSHIFAFSHKGCMLAGRLSDWLAGAGFENTCHTSVRLAPAFSFQPLKGSLTESVGGCFAASELLVFIGAAGIAVRAIAPYIDKKTSDPAVIVIDDCGTFTISLLSGHLGKANLLTEKISRFLCSTPVITTATDRNQRFSPDGWAAAHGLKVEDMSALKAVSARILEEDVAVSADFPLPPVLPAGLSHEAPGPFGVYITYKAAAADGQTVKIIPPVLHLGIGCRRGTAQAALKDFISQTLAAAGLHQGAVAAVASIDLKQDEEGLVSYCQERSLPLYFYTSHQLEETAGDFTASAFVKSITGIDNVCERAALKSCKNGRLLQKKTAWQGMTIAIAIDEWRIPFDDES